MKKYKITEVLGDIENYQNEIFVNEEHYNNMGLETRKYILELASSIGDKGFFCEAGACMGTDTKLLEACGWEGLLVEPSLGLYQYCKETRNCIVENYALVSQEYYTKSNKVNLNQIPCFGITHLLPKYPPNSFEIEAITFTLLAKKNNIDKIDIFVLDVEGLEIEVMSGIDFNQVKIDNFIIECNYGSYSIEMLNDFMSSKGYENVGLVEKLGESHSDYHYKKI
jgi:FkbM family methyltransferase